jgi:hypothetical protein
MVTIQDLPDNWRTSSYSPNGSDCVEVADSREVALVRDTKNRGAGHITVSADAWSAFLRVATRGC